jgi:hypothetical protein
MTMAALTTMSQTKPVMNLNDAAFIDGNKALGEIVALDRRNKEKPSKALETLPHES